MSVPAAGMLPIVDPLHVVGVHLSGTGAAPPFGPPLGLDGFSPADRARAEKFNKFREEGLGYLILPSHPPANPGLCPQQLAGCGN